MPKAAKLAASLAYGARSNWNVGATHRRRRRRRRRHTTIKTFQLGEMGIVEHRCKNDFEVYTKKGTP